MQYHITTIVIFLLGMQLTPTWASNCYVCTGVEGTACYDTFNKNGADVITVDSPSGWCVKVKSEALGMKTVSRTAGDTTRCTSAGCIKQSVPGLAVSTQCCCNGDLCNSTGRLTSTMTIGIILSLFVLAFKKLMF